MKAGIVLDLLPYEQPYPTILIDWPLKIQVNRSPILETSITLFITQHIALHISWWAFQLFS